MKRDEIRAKLVEKVVKYEGTKKFDYYNEAAAELRGFDTAIKSCESERDRLKELLSEAQSWFTYQYPEDEPEYLVFRDEIKKALGPSNEK